ncbi:MAG TPA: protein kinase [Burkholderiaceae bacterium]|nr:protein kinase [Burkholderiaceae bacterium]
MVQSLPANQKVIGRYTILRELRRDRHSVSYAAVDPVMNRELVVKAVQIVPAGPPMRAEARRRIEQAFVRQAQAAGRLHHPNILTVFDAGLGHEFGYLVIERVAGRSLQDLLGSGVKFTDLQCAGIGARVADALEYAHGQGVSHGQLGPQHVYVQADGSPKVSGFGGWIDAGTEGDDALTRTEQFLPYFQSEVTDETRRRDMRAVASLLCTMIQARPHAVTVPNAPNPPAGSSQRPSTIPAFSALLSDTLDTKSLTASKTAGELRDALIAFVLAERANRPAAATLGVSLSASIPATTGPGEAAAPAAPAPAASQRPDLVALALERAGESLHSARIRLSGLGPWALRHRLALSMAAALLVAGLALGNLLGQLRPARGADPPGAAPQAADAVVPAADLVAASAAPSTGIGASGTVVFRIEPWGEILIDKKPTGVSPPLIQIALPAGLHQIEVRHGNDAPWATQIKVEAAVPVTVLHRFGP